MEFELPQSELGDFLDAEVHRKKLEFELFQFSVFFQIWIYFILFPSLFAFLQVFHSVG